MNFFRWLTISLCCIGSTGLLAMDEKKHAASLQRPASSQLFDEESKIEAAFVRFSKQIDIINKAQIAQLGLPENMDPKIFPLALTGAFVASLPHLVHLMASPTPSQRQSVAWSSLALMQENPYVRAGTFALGLGWTSYYMYKFGGQKWALNKRAEHDQAIHDAAQEINAIKTVGTPKEVAQAFYIPEPHAIAHFTERCGHNIDYINEKINSINNNLKNKSCNEAFPLMKEACDEINSIASSLEDNPLPDPNGDESDGDKSGGDRKESSSHSKRAFRPQISDAELMNIMMLGMMPGGKIDQQNIGLLQNKNTLSVLHAFRTALAQKRGGTSIPISGHQEALKRLQTAVAQKDYQSINAYVSGVRNLIAEVLSLYSVKSSSSSSSSSASADKDHSENEEEGAEIDVIISESSHSASSSSSLSSSSSSSSSTSSSEMIMTPLVKTISQSQTPEKNGEETGEEEDYEEAAEEDGEEGE